MEKIKSTENPITVECPNCDGYGGLIDDNNNQGWSTCSCCDGKGYVSWKTANEWHSWDKNGGANVM